MAACGALVLVGVLAVVRWGGVEVEVPPADDSSDVPSAALVGRRYLRYRSHSSCPPRPFLAFFAVMGALAVGLSRVRPVVAFLGSPRALLIGRVVLGVLALVALPGSVSAVADIAGRGP